MRIPSFSDVNQVALGIVAIIVTMLFVTAAFAVGSLDLLEDRYQMSAVFPSSGGIRTSDKVRVAGLDVGSVTAVEPDFELGVVVVTFEVDSNVELGSDTSAEISLSTLLGGRYLRLDGPVEAPYMKDLPTGERRIPVERTRLPIDVQDALGRVTSAIDEIDADQVDSLLTNLADISADNAGSFEPLLDNVVLLSKTLNERRSQIDALLANTKTLTSTLATKDDQLVALIDQAGQLLETVATRRDQLSALFGAGSEVTQDLDRLIKANRASLDAILADLDDTTNVLQNRLPELNQTLAYLGPTIDGLAASTESGPWIDTVVTGLGLLQLTDLVESLG